MADTKISALTAVTTPAGTDEIPVNQSGTTKKLTLGQIVSYTGAQSAPYNASVANQSFTTSDTYITGSYIVIPSGRLQAKTMYRMKMQLTKTSSTSSTSAPILTVRLGAAGTTADTSRAVLTFAAQTAVIDVGFIEVFVTFRTVGSGTSAVIQAVGMLDHQLAATGLSTANVSLARTTSAGFDSTTANLGIGVSFNGGTSFAGNTDLVQAELFNLS